MSYGVHIISPCQLCDQWDWSVGSRTIFISPPFSLSSSRLSLSFKLLFSPSLSLYLSPSLARSLCLSSLFFFFFFFWPGRPSQCEIMVNAPWQSDTTHSPGPAPSGFNLIWSEKNGRGGGVMMVVVVVKGCRVGGEMKGWRTGCLWSGGVVGVGGTRWKLAVLFSAEIVSPSFILPKLPSPLLTFSISSPEKKSKMIDVRSKVSKNMLKICKRTGHGLAH